MKGGRGMFISNALISYVLHTRGTSPYPFTRGIMLHPFRASTFRMTF